MKLGENMKKFIFVLLCIVLGITYLNRDTIILYIVKNFLYQETNILEVNQYHKNNDFGLVKNIENLTPTKKEDFNNIFYTILNSGMVEVTIYCDIKYENCINDLNDYTKNSKNIETINNYVNPFNSFKNISISTDNFNRINITIDKTYTTEQIDLINSFLNKFITENINNSMTDREKIKIFHDYIINNTKYDSNYQINSDKNAYSGSPYNAYGVVTEGKAICGGYSDIMAIYLDKLEIKNYKISSEEHIWNYVYIDNSWYHIDLTWDDPVTNTGADMLIYDFFLINSKQLEKKETTQHTYDKTLYLEAQ